MGEPVLHRDDPKAEPLAGNVKVTRDDWLRMGLNVLITDGAERIKVLLLHVKCLHDASAGSWLKGGIAATDRFRQ